MGNKKQQLMCEWYCRECGPVDVTTGVKEVGYCPVCDVLRATQNTPAFVTAMKKRINKLETENKTLRNGLMIQTDQVDHSATIIDELEKVAEAAVGVYRITERDTVFHNELRDALREAGYLGVSDE